MSFKSWRWLVAWCISETGRERPTCCGDVSGSRVMRDELGVGGGRGRLMLSGSTNSGVCIDGP